MASHSCRIRLLPDLLVSKIAAGEVVERPASVVKELMENSLDAAATRIAVAVEDGGRQLIRVSDNGSGMSVEELALAVRPHATSKVVSEDDLYAIRTMGFRGEALASIGSVSHMRIVSRQEGSAAGSEIRVSADRVEGSGAAGCPVGTTVEVRELFFNVPARRRFLRGAGTEVGHVNEQFARLALSHPTVGFELTINSRSTQMLPAAQTTLERIARFYGPELSSALIHVSRQERGISIEAYAAPPVHSRATPQWQYLFVNGRFVRDRFISHAIKEAYRGLMEPNRHGVVFLFLEIDPGEIDVNVHPMKLEVRWADSNMIHSQVLSALRETFQRCDLAPALRTREETPIDSIEQQRMREELAAMLKTTAPIRGAAGFPSSSQVEPGPGTQSNVWPVGRASSQGLGDLPAEHVWRALYGHGGQTADSPAVDAPVPPPSIPAESLAAGPRAIQMHNLYLVAETEEGIVIIDQHALHERVMYEQLRARFTGGALESQRLLLPETIRVTGAQAALLQTHRDLLGRLGLEVAPFGPDSVAVQSFPVLLSDSDVPAFMKDLLDHLEQHAGDNSQEVLIHEILDLMACKAAVKAGDALTRDEIEALIAQRHLVEKSSSCPHGRPTMLRLTKADLNRQFKRT